MYRLFGRVNNGHDELKSAIDEYLCELVTPINETVVSNAGRDLYGHWQIESSFAEKWSKEVCNLENKFKYNDTYKMAFIKLIIPFCLIDQIGQNSDD